MPTSVLFPAGGGFAIDGIFSDTWYAYVRNYQIALLPSIRSKLRSIPGRTGKFNPGQELDSRLISVDMTIATTARSGTFAAMRALATQLDPRVGAHTLEFTDDNPGWYVNVTHSQDAYVAPLQLDPVSGLAVVQFTLACECPDGYWWSDTISTVSWAVSGGVSGSGSTLTVSNPGNDSTPIELTIRHPGGAGTLTGIVIGGFPGGATVGYSGSMVAGDVLAINTDQWTVTKNGVSDIAHWTGQMPALPAGLTTLTWSDTNHIGMLGSLSYQARSL